MKLDVSEFKIKSEHTETKLYTLTGLESFVDDDGFPRLSIEDHKTFAKAIKNKLGKAFTSSMQYRFYIKTDPSKKILDPIQRHSIKESKGSFVNKICKSETVFSEVSEYIFNQYINFLKTKNPHWLQNAQREMK
jgi:hypothetical protein